MAAGTAALAALVAVAASLYVHVQNDFGPLDIYAPPQVVNTSVEELFSDSYYHARALFRTHLEAAELTLFTLPLDGYAHLDLTIDVAVVEGAKDRVLLHVSGTHGVEGFAGSAIQSALLTRRKQASAGKSKVETQQPTVIFVHALNPYGFSQLRRFNEHNVDLNRNWLTPEQFNAFAAQDPNTNGYMDLYDTLNPSSIGGALDSFWVKAAYHVATKGFTAVKRTLVSSNYHFSNATYYGGDKLEPSLVLLRDFLKQHVDLDGVKAFGMIDVHTGLGPAGVDTLLLGWPSDANKVASVFGGIEKLTPVHGGDANNDVSGGYETTAGFILDGVAALLPSASHKNNVLLAQEFGTVPGVFIVKAGVDEAFVYRNARGRRLPYAEKLRDVFYLHRSASWKAAVVQRGVAVFDQVYEHIATCA